MNNRNLEDLSDDVKYMALAFIDSCKREGIDVLIYCTLRSNEEQDALYAQGRTTPGKIRTNARAGQSAHNPDKSGKSRAFDCCPMLYGKPEWNTSSPLWMKMGVIGESVGLEWSGRWNGKLREMAHFQRKSK